MRLKFIILVNLTFLLVLCTAWADTPPVSKTLRVYYFHRTLRCHSCLLLEELTKQTLFDHFKKELDSGRIEFRIINIDEKASAHFEKDYALEFQSVVLSSLENGKETSWKNLSLIWDYLEDESKLTAYIRDEIINSIGESG